MLEINPQNFMNGYTWYKKVSKLMLGNDMDLENQDS